MLFLLQQLPVPSLPTDSQTQAAQDFPWGWLVSIMFLIIVVLFVAYQLSTNRTIKSLEASNRQSVETLQGHNAANMDLIQKLSERDLEIKEALLKFSMEMRDNTIKVSDLIMELNKRVDRLDRDVEDLRNRNG